MATTTNYGWTTPDDTSLVKDGASAIRTLGTSIDTTTKNLNPSTTLGDIEYRSSTANTNTRLPIGTSGQVLAVSGGVPAWTTPAGAGANFTLINAGGTAMSGSSTVTVSGISGMDKLFIWMYNGSSVSTSINVTLRINADSGASQYSYAGSLQESATTYSGGNFTGRSAYSADSSFPVCKQSNTATNEFFAGITILGSNSSGKKVIQLDSGIGGTGSGGICYNISGIYNGTSTVSSISIISSSGNFDDGTIYVYGSAG